MSRRAADLGVTLRATLDAVVERRRINRALVRSARELAKPGDTAHA